MQTHDLERRLYLQQIRRVGTGWDVRVVIEGLYYRQIESRYIETQTGSRYIEPIAMVRASRLGLTYN